MNDEPTLSPRVLATGIVLGILAWGYIVACLVALAGPAK